MTLTGIEQQKLEKHIHKQIGCMAGFLQIFIPHRHHTTLSTKTLPVPPAASPEQPRKDLASPAHPSPSPTKKEKQHESKSAFPVLEFKEGTKLSSSSWKFSKEAPRLSLDSRAVIDAKGTLHTTTNVDKQRHSISTTSVIAKLMGLDDSDSPAKLQRSASESRVPRDLPIPHSRRYSDSISNIQQNTPRGNAGLAKQNVNPNFNASANSPVPQKQRTTMLQKKKNSFYDAADFFPEMKQTVSIYQVIEKRLRVRGINHPSQDLHTLKHILEAMQLKGLLHSEKPINPSPIVLMKPPRGGVRSPSSFHRKNNQSPPPLSTLRTRQSPNEAADRSMSPNRRKMQNVETQRRRVSHDSVHSPKMRSPRNTGGSPRMMRKSSVTKVKIGAGDEFSTMSDNSFNSSLHTTDTEQRYYILEEYREGRNVLERCDMLLNRIAEITAANELLQPSPVSVLESSSFYNDDECCSPSPITKRCCIDYRGDQAMESEDDMWSAALGSSSEGKSEDCDFAYVSKILNAFNYFPEEKDISMLLEKKQQQQQQCLKGNNTWRLQKRLVFDTLQEILYQNQRLPPWTAVSRGDVTQVIRSEFRRIREREEPESSEDLFGVISGVLKKDMAEEMGGWGDIECPVEMGDVVLDIERLVFKDLIGETIHNLASFARQCSSNRLSPLRRKLVF